MIYLKSFLVGVGIFVLTVILGVVFTQIYLRYWLDPASMSGVVTEGHPVTDGNPGFEMREEWVNVPVLPAGLIAFAGGFYWMYKKQSVSSKRNLNSPR